MMDTELQTGQEDGLGENGTEDLLYAANPMDYTGKEPDVWVE